ncbi:GNAT family N-acetyltransferase [Ascidiimonas sp. W6]|uniref:GNAT family N-acetyltransferase n=1 Tax=Ascidiimonas meishanensis TaxID=3128903 RepID=UPI0030EB6857
MENVKINGKLYRCIVNYKNDDNLRNSFNSLTRKTYGFDFDDWYQNGYWSDNYIPYSLADGNNIVSNISVSIIDFLVSGKKRTYLQIGTVMTDMEYRNQGLNRILMEKVLEEWRGKCDLIYLFANDTVLDFYPKFGFKTAKEYKYSKKVNLKHFNPDFINLNMLDKKNKDFLVNKVNHSYHFSEVSMKDNASLILFYCTLFMNKSVYYIKKLDAIVIAEFSSDILHINDIFCEKNVPMDNLISYLLTKEIKEVVLGFMPKDTTSFNETVLEQEGDTLFILDDKWSLFDTKKLRFPILSHA